MILRWLLLGTTHLAYSTAIPEREPLYDLFTELVDTYELDSLFLLSWIMSNEHVFFAFISSSSPKTFSTALAKQFSPSAHRGRRFELRAPTFFDIKKAVAEYTKWITKHVKDRDLSDLESLFRDPPLTWYPLYPMSKTPPSSLDSTEFEALVSKEITPAEQDELETDPYALVVK